MTVAEVRTHIRHTGWASRRVLDAAMSLTPEQQVKAIDVSQEGIAKTIFHSYMADRIRYK